MKARGNVEEWLGKVEEAMVVRLRRDMKQALLDVDKMSRDDWLISHANQITLTVEQLVWARKVHEILDNQNLESKNRLEALKEYEKELFAVRFSSLDVLMSIVMLSGALNLTL